MFQFGSNQHQALEKWRIQVDRFVAENEIELAALAWSLQQEWNDNNLVLGVDLKPKPHFVVCAKENLEQLNHNTKGHIQEILGIVDGYQRDSEIIIITIGEGQIKLINFQPPTPPPICAEQVTADIDHLIELLEKKLAEYLS